MNRWGHESLGSGRRPTICERCPTRADEDRNQLRLSCEATPEARSEHADEVRHGSSFLSAGKLTFPFRVSMPDRGEGFRSIHKNHTVGFLRKSYALITRP